MHFGAADFPAYTKKCDAKLAGIKTRSVWGSNDFNHSSILSSRKGYFRTRLYHKLMLGNYSNQAIGYCKNIVRTSNFIVVLQ